MDIYKSNKRWARASESRQMIVWATSWTRECRFSFYFRHGESLCEHFVSEIQMHNVYYAKCKPSGDLGIKAAKFLVRNADLGEIGKLRPSLRKIHFLHSILSLKSQT